MAAYNVRLAVSYPGDRLRCDPPACFSLGPMSHWVQGRIRSNVTLDIAQSLWYPIPRGIYRMNPINIVNPRLLS